MLKRRGKNRAQAGAGTPLTAAEVLDRLAQIELDGLAFYRGLSRGTRLDKVRQLAEMMIKAEQRHHDRFSRYAAIARASADPADNALTAALPPEVMHLMSDRVFLSGELGEKAGQNVDERQALKVGIRAEENTVLLLSQLRSYVPGNRRGYIDRVIKEEQNHQDKLESLYRKCFP